MSPSNIVDTMTLSCRDPRQRCSCQRAAVRTAARAALDRLFSGDATSARTVANRDLVPSVTLTERLGVNMA
jgi:hypothetical protein